MRLSISPDNLRYTQDSISSNFQEGESIEEAINDVVKGVSSVESFPRMKVYRFACKFWCQNNRRLYVMKELQRRGHIKEIVVDYVGKKPHDEIYFTTITAGKSIRVRERSGIADLNILDPSFADLPITVDQCNSQYHNHYDNQYDDQYEDQYDDLYNDHYDKQYDDHYNNQYDDQFEDRYDCQYRGKYHDPYGDDDNDKDDYRYHGQYYDQYEHEDYDEYDDDYYDVD